MPRFRSAALSLLAAGTVAVALPASPAVAAHKPKHPAVNTAKLKSLTAKINGAEKGTFKAVYSVHTAAETTTLTVAQAPPKRYFAVSSAVFIDTGTASYYCSTAGAKVCFKTSGSANELAGLEALISPTAALDEFNAARSEASAHLAGYHLSFSTKTVAGQPSTCVTGSAGGRSGTYCVTSFGLLSSESSEGEGFTLVSFSRSVPSSQFSLPAGATVTSGGGNGIP